MYDHQTQILIGTVLGGSSLVKPPRGINYYVSMRSNNDIWLEYKMIEMPDYFPEPKMRKYGNTNRCNSLCHEKITEIRELLYDGTKRKMDMPLLDGLMDTGIAVWFLDSGGKTGRDRKNAYLNTTRFGEQGTNLIRQYFCEVGMECRINRDGRRLKVLFTVDGTLSLLKTIAHRFPHFMINRV